MALTYYQIRSLHFKGTLATWFKDLNKAIFSVASIVGSELFVIVAFLLMAIAGALSLLGSPTTSSAKRAFIILAWQIGTYIVLRSLREAALMPRARHFFDTLPVSRLDKLRADSWIAIRCYSILWLPVAWVIGSVAYRGVSSERLLSLLSIAELVALSLCVNLLMLRQRRRESGVALLALAVFTVSNFQSVLGTCAQFGALALANASLWKGYEYAQDDADKIRANSAFVERLAIDSGLLISFLSNELRVTFLIRIATVSGSLVACALLLGIRESHGSAIGALVFVAAVATIALYSLPALCRATVLSKLDFVAGHPTFRRRLSIAAFIIPTLIFVVTLFIAYCLADVFTAPEFLFRQHAFLPLIFFSGTYLVGVVATRIGIQSATWIIPLASLVAAIVLSGLI